MANTFSIYYDPDTPTTAAVEVADADNLWVTHGLQVRVSLRSPGSFTPTQIKVWGIDGITTESGASWQPMSATITGTLQDIEEMQYVNARFWDGGSNYATATSSGILYAYTAPRINTAVQWKTAPVDEGSTIGVLTNTAQDTELTLDKSKFVGLLFHEADFRDFSIAGGEYSTTITATSGSEIYQLLKGDANSYIPVEKTFSNTSKTPFIIYDDGVAGFKTATKYNGTIKTSYNNKFSNVSWTSGTGKLTFRIQEFSRYGFANIDKVEFTFDSSAGGYKNTSITLKVKVTDTNGEGVEGAPVAFSRSSGTDIGDLGSSPVNTDASGFATISLAVDTVGTAVFHAEVEGVGANSSIYCIELPVSSQRSLLTQYEQIRWSADYIDTVSGVNTAAVAEPEGSTFSGSADSVLEHDMNVYRTLLKQLKGTTDWFGDPGKYFDPTNTDGSHTANKQITLENIKGNTLDSKTILISIEEDNGGAGYAVNTGFQGVLFLPTDARYADPVDRRGMPIFASTAHSGAYQDIGGTDDVCVVDVIDRSTGSSFRNSFGHLVYGKLHDGSDYSGTGEGHDVYMKFYADGVPYTLQADDPKNIMFIYPFRKVLSSMQEYEWMRTDFISSWEGDTEVIEDITNLWSFTGALNNQGIPIWSNTGNYYSVISGSNIQSAVNALNTSLGDHIYDEHNYVHSGETISTSLNYLDLKVKDLIDAVNASTGSRYIETPVSDIVAGTTHSLPFSLTYTPESTSGQEGKNLDVFVNGMLLNASTGVNGNEEDRDYSEVSGTEVKFHIDVNAYSNIMYVVRQ